MQSGAESTQSPVAGAVAGAGELTAGELATGKPEEAESLSSADEAGELVSTAGEVVAMMGDLTGVDGGAGTLDGATARLGDGELTCREHTVCLSSRDFTIRTARGTLWHASWLQVVCCKAAPLVHVQAHTAHWQ